jgi:hypothetical protein
MEKIYGNEIKQKIIENKFTNNEINQIKNVEL